MERITDSALDTLLLLRRAPGLFTGQFTESDVAALEAHGLVERRYEGVAGSMGLSRLYPTVS